LHGNIQIAERWFARCVEAGSISFKALAVNPGHGMSAPPARKSDRKAIVGCGSAVIILATPLTFGSCTLNPAQ
jgi:hypothetical protein